MVLKSGKSPASHRQYNHCIAVLTFLFPFFFTSSFSFFNLFFFFFFLSLHFYFIYLFCFHFPLFSNKASSRMMAAITVVWRLLPPLAVTIRWQNFTKNHLNANFVQSAILLQNLAKKGWEMIISCVHDNKIQLTEFGYMIFYP